MWRARMHLTVTLGSGRRRSISTDLVLVRRDKVSVARTLLVEKAVRTARRMSPSGGGSGWDRRGPTHRLVHAVC